MMGRGDRVVHRRGHRRVMAMGAVAAALAIAMLGCGGGGDDDDGGDGVPDPYLLPAEGPPACELSADCPAGTHCDLGQCYQSCNTAVACELADVECSNRGRCQTGDPGDNDVEPPPATDNDAEIPVPAGEEILLGETDAVAMLELTASPLRRPAPAAPGSSC